MHSCPECGDACYCNGDIDDIDSGDTEAADNCQCDCREVYGDEDDDEAESGGAMSEPKPMSEERLKECEDLAEELERITVPYMPESDDAPRIRELIAEVRRLQKEVEAGDG